MPNSRQRRTAKMRQNHGAPNICLVLAVVVVSCTLTDGALSGPLSWGTFLGANWRIGEENLRNELARDLGNTHKICEKDVERLCAKGRDATDHTWASTDWSGQYKRHAYNAWEDLPLGFGDAADACLRGEFNQYQTGGVLKRMIPKCAACIWKTELQFITLYTREKGNDKRELVVMFATIFAAAVSGAVGYMLGIFLKERDDLFSYHKRDENKRMLIFFCVATSLPMCLILWASPKLLVLMASTFGIGRGVQFYVQKKRDGEYSLVASGSDSGIVFTAIPVQMH